MRGKAAFTVGVVGWALAITEAVLVPGWDARGYATFWTGVLTLVAAFFVVGYVALSRPTRDENGHRKWSPEWFWLPSLPAVILFVYANQFVFRLIIPAPTNPTSDQILAQRWAAGIAASVFFLLLWLTVMWARRQVMTRRARKANA